MMDRGEYKVEFAPIPWQTPMRGLRYKACRRGEKQLRLVEYAAEMEPHWCEKGHYGYILAGTIEIEFVTGRQTFKAGEGVFIPSGVLNRHRARVVSDSVTALFVEISE